MILWFAAPAVIGAWAVLRDPRFDYRLAALGALLPDLIDLPFGHRALAHTLLFAVATLVAVMAVTRSRALRSRLLAVPVGLFVHLVLHGVVGRSSLLYWPFLGDWGDLPLAPALPGGVIREAIGLAAGVWVWRRFGLSDRSRRMAFLRHGRLEPC